MSKVGRGGCRRHQNRLGSGKDLAGGTAMTCPSGIYDTQNPFCITFDERAESPQLNTSFSSGVATHLGTLLVRKARLNRVQFSDGKSVAQQVGWMNARLIQAVIELLAQGLRPTGAKKFAGGCGE